MSVTAAAKPGLPLFPANVCVSCMLCGQPATADPMSNRTPHPVRAPEALTAFPAALALTAGHPGLRGAQKQQYQRVS